MHLDENPCILSYLLSFPPSPFCGVYCIGCDDEPLSVQFSCVWSKSWMMPTLPIAPTCKTCASSGACSSFSRSLYRSWNATRFTLRWQFHIFCRRECVPASHIAQSYTFLLGHVLNWNVKLKEICKESFVGQWVPDLKVKVKFCRYRPGVAQRMGRGIALLFHDRGTRRGWVVSSTPRPHFTPEKDPVPILQESDWAPGPIWTGGRSLPHRDSIPDVQPVAQSLYRLNYRPTGTWLTFFITRVIMIFVTLQRPVGKLVRRRETRTRGCIKWGWPFDYLRGKETQQPDTICATFLPQILTHFDHYESAGNCSSKWCLIDWIMLL